jgi:GPN-loop GTPase
MYKTRLPLLIVFNKIDVVGHGFAQDWMRDVETFEEALQAEKTFRTTLTRSLAFVMDEFYKNIKTCGVSSVTGIGIDDFFAKLDECAGEYERDYRPFLQERLRERNEQIETLKETRLKQAQEQMRKPDVVVDATAEDRENPEEKDEEEDGSDLEPFDNFDYEQDRHDYEEYMAQLRERESSQ